MEAIVLAAGKGTRLRSKTVKVLHPIFDLPVLGHVLSTLSELKVKKPRVVVGNQADQVKSYLKKTERSLKIKPQTFLQKEQNGTGHAVLMAQRGLATSNDDVLIWPGDMPLLKAETLKAFIKAHRKSKACVSVLSSIQPEPFGYGRILREDGEFCGIREEVDASDSEKAITEVNSGIYLFKAKDLFRSLKKVKPNNKKAEYYLTDTIEVLKAEGKKVAAFAFAHWQEGLGINSRADLAQATEVVREREVEKHMAAGVSFLAPAQSFVGRDTKIGQDTVVYPWCFIDSGVKIGVDCKIGPFAKINAGSVIEDGATIGSYVEVTRSRIGKNVTAKHLAYLGDATIGEGCNIGAGTITANFDGKKKHKSRLGKNVLTGSNTVFVAPVEIGDEVRTGAGSVVKGGAKISKGDVVAGIPARSIKKT